MDEATFLEIAARARKAQEAINALGCGPDSVAPKQEADDDE